MSSIYNSPTYFSVVCDATAVSVIHKGGPGWRSAIVFGLHMGSCQNEFLLMCAANMKVRHVYFVTTDLSFILLDII